MSAGYVIEQLKVTNPENYKEYVDKVSKIVEKFGGEYLVRSGEYQVVEGEDIGKYEIINIENYDKIKENIDRLRNHMNIDLHPSTINNIVLFVI